MSTNLLLISQSVAVVDSALVDSIASFERLILVV